MVAHRKRLSNKNQTAGSMYDTVKKTAADLKRIKIAGTPVSEMPLNDFYDFVRNIPYRRDPKPREILARPKYLIKYRKAGLDCKKKALLMASWAALNNIPFRFIATSRKRSRRVHHVLPQLFISGRFIDTDATYPINQINKRKSITNLVILRGEQ